MGVRGSLPRFRLRTKQALRPRQWKKTPKKKTERILAVQTGRAPKACKPFALYMKATYQLAKGASKAEHNEEMKRLGRMWRTLPEAVKSKYVEESRTSFSAQREALRVSGINFRLQQDKPNDQVREEPLEQQGASAGPAGYVQVGNYRCTTENGSCLYLGEGTYGAVLLSQTDAGRKCVLKVFKH